MIVRMLESRVICFDVANPTPLQHGREYDLPEAYAAYLIHQGKAEWRPGKKLRGTRHKEIAVPVRAPGAPTGGQASGKKEKPKGLVRL